ncbi:lactoylglutathione lyase-like lyase [Fusarium subglutinans]|uniref:Lactoylglutathione lyase-like lyase n=1 Tax=Gibberella subglutinans TaxID=42677 RepID=A0A8H5P3U9_GIBSU|nr:lactoylglutathione lyase-like lyase [Fusarium subglutinans]KAF5588744.1 lactoylglutathione lyase-like lyase [Fusarium subglutinans]
MRHTGRLTATRGATYKTAGVAIPNQDWTLNLTEYTGISKKQIKQREKDPAAPALTLTVKNATAINNALRRANVSTIDGSPIPKGGAEGTTSTVWVYDPDGYMVELVQRSGPSDYFTVSEPNITNGPGMEYVIRGQLDLTMYNVTGAITFYKDILGQNISRGFEPLIGPGVSIIYPAQDPGVAITTYLVENLDAIVKKVKAAKIKIITEGDKPVWIDGKKSIVVRDPAGYLVRLDQAC